MNQFTCTAISTAFISLGITAALFFVTNCQRSDDEWHAKKELTKMECDTKVELERIQLEKVKAEKGQFSSEWILTPKTK